MAIQVAAVAASTLVFVLLAYATISACGVTPVFPVRSVRSPITWMSGILSFAPGPLPLLADALCWATLIPLALLVMRLVAGPASADRLRRSAGRR
jgi:hypothetical protein